MTHGSKELDEDAKKLLSLGQDPGPTLEDLGLIEPKPPYPFCRTPKECAGKGYCTKDPACNE